ncbi:MAG: response regulator [Leptospiraceae bacterium]|nr:response regulator [Leptospiraceae bacterium]
MYLPTFLERISSCGILATDSMQEKLNKRILCITSFLITIAGFIWGVMYMQLKLYLAAIFPVVYSCIVGLTLILFSKYKNFKVFVNIQLLLILILPFCLQWSLGGFSNSGVVMVWAILAPFGSLVFQNNKKATFWLIAYIVLAFISVAHNYYYPGMENPKWMRLLFFSTNILAVSLLSFFVMLYFVTESKKEFVRQSIIERQEEAIETTQRIAKSYARFIPSEFLTFLNKDSITDLKLGDYMEDEMTVFFSDIRGFTTLSEKMSSRDLLQFLNSYLSIVSPIVKSNDGFIDKFIGDAIMAIFPQSPINALMAAVDLCKALEIYNITREKKIRETFRIGIGMHTGKMTLGTVGSEERMDTTVVGDTVNLASRLEALTKIFHVPILVSDSFYDKLTMEDKENLREIDIVTVKGKTVPVRVYEVFAVDTKEVIEKKKKSMPALLEAIQLFRSGKILESRKIFTKCQELCPEDSIPVVYINRCDTVLSEITKQSQNPINKNIKILIVDDNIAVLDYMQYILKKNKFEVIAAMNGKEAVLKYGELSPNYVLLDISMPDMDGLQVAEIIQGFAEQRNESPKIIFVTSKEEASMKETIQNLGYGFLPKPLDINDLLKIIEN